MENCLRNDSSSSDQLAMTAAAAAAAAADTREMCHLFKILFNSGLIGVVSVLGLAGNVLSLRVLYTDRQNRVASFLLQALAVADTAVLVMSCLVLTFLYGFLHSQTTYVAEWTDFIFKYVNSLGYTTQGVTIWFTVLLAINRYIAVCKPLHAYRLSVRGAQIQTGAVVIVSFISNIPRIFLYDLRSQVPHPPPVAAGRGGDCPPPSAASQDGLVLNCTTTILLLDIRNSTTRSLDFGTRWDGGGRSSSDTVCNGTMATDANDTRLPLAAFAISQRPFMLFEVLYTAIILILPLIILVGLNLRLIHELQSAKRRRRHLSRGYTGSNEDNITVVMIVVIIVVVICHTPDRIIQILRWIPRESTRSRGCPDWMYFVLSVSNLLIILNSSINFLIYCVLRKRFRRILVIKICQRRRGRTSHGGGASNHSALLRSLHYAAARTSDIVELKSNEGGPGGGAGGGGNSGGGGGPSERRANCTSFAVESIRSDKQSLGSPIKYSLLF